MESPNLEEVQEYMESQKINKVPGSGVMYHLDYWGQKKATVNNSASNNDQSMGGRNHTRWLKVKRHIFCLQKEWCIFCSNYTSY